MIIIPQMLSTGERGGGKLACVCVVGKYILQQHVHVICAQVCL